MHALCFWTACVLHVCLHVQSIRQYAGKTRVFVFVKVGFLEKSCVSIFAHRLTVIWMCVCVCVCAHMCVCVCVCVISAFVCTQFLCVEYLNGCLYPQWHTQGQQYPALKQLLMYLQLPALKLVFPNIVTRWRCGCLLRPLERNGLFSASVMDSLCSSPLSTVLCYL